MIKSPAGQIGECIVLQFVFIVISTLGLAAALGTVLAKNLVRAALYLVAFFFTVACHFVLLEAEFLAALQVLVYIGAVAILLMFGIMLTRNIQGDDPSNTASAWRLPGVVAGLCLFLVLAYGIANQKPIGTEYSWAANEVRPALDPPSTKAQSPRTAAVNNMAKVVGDELMTRYVIGFEVAGLLLTVALVGAIAVAHREEEDASAPRASPRATREPGSPVTADGPASIAASSPSPG
jgi:NADH:ubiquinone oxidoreductase subunit 6 (subunit J)